MTFLATVAALELGSIRAVLAEVAHLAALAALDVLGRARFGAVASTMAGLVTVSASVLVDTRHGAVAEVVA